MFDIFGDERGNKKKRTLTTAQLKDFKAAVGKCEICGKKFSVSVLQHHHIVPKEKGGSDNLLTNVLVVCGTCHDMAHKGFYKQKELREKIKKRSKKVVEQIKAIESRRRSLRRRKKGDSHTGFELDVSSIDIPDPFASPKKGRSKKKKRNDDWFGF